MKKFLLSFFSILILFSIASCKKEESKGVSVIVPTGTPALGLATPLAELKNNEQNTVDIVAGSDLLIAAFTKADYDIVIAPVNLGAKMYQTNQNYLLYKAFVWGNLYVVSTNKIETFKDLSNQDVTIFGKNSTPDIILKALMNYYKIDINLNYVDDVTTANVALVSGKANIIVSAEPSLSKINASGKYYTLDLQSCFAEMTGKTSYPQAGIFVKKDVRNNKEIKDVLSKFNDAVNETKENPANVAKNAVKIHSSFETLGEGILTSAIPNCHYDILDNDKEAVNFYLQKMIDLGFGAQVGGVLPNDEFYY